MSFPGISDRPCATRFRSVKRRRLSAALAMPLCLKAEACRARNLPWRLPASRETDSNSEIVKSLRIRRDAIDWLLLIGLSQVWYQSIFRRSSNIRTVNRYQDSIWEWLTAGDWIFHGNVSCESVWNSTVLKLYFVLIIDNSNCPVLFD